jgi:carbon-monoxide dehydrogenase large subunit
MVKFGIGQAITRREDDRLLTGQGRFVDDIAVPGALHAMFVRSPYAHARIRSIDSAEARAIEGVVAILTGADLEADGVAPFPANPMLKPAAGKPATTAPFHVLAVNAVRFVGQPVAVVLAESRAAAERAANLVAVDCEPLPAVATLVAALAPDAPLVWPDAPGNVAGTASFGDRAACDRAFAAAKHVTRITVDNQRLSPVTLEPRGCVAEFDGTSGRLTFHATSQNPASYQGTLAKMLKLAPEQVRVVVGDVGGGFGMKALVHPEDVVCAYAARKMGRPVRWRATRLEEFQAASHGRDQRAEAELAFDADGRILGMRVRIVGALGAYGHGAGAAIHLAIGPKVTTGVYHVPVLDLQAKAVLTNTNVIGAYRGAGRPEAIYLIERLMDRAAAELKLDPAELRRRNLVQPGQMPYRNAMGETFDSGDFPNLLAKALRAADWTGFDGRRRDSEAHGKLRGRAVSTFLEWTGVVHEETVRLHVEGDGRVRVFTAMQAMGQGIETSYVQILAETLQLDPDCFEIVQGDSDVAQGIGSMGSRSLYIGGSAMQTASQQAIDVGRDLAAKALEAPAADLVYAEGRYKVVGTDLGVDLTALARQQPEQRIAVTTVQKVGGPSWPNGCHVCEVEIDPETGHVEIVRYTTYDDVGRVINPLIVAGQVHGGIAQAVGQALHEQVVYDAEGQLLTGSFMDYGIPRADDLPEFATHTDESQPCKINPLGAKGVGELGTVGATPTVINAIVDALRPLGVDDIAMPATPERVWRAIRDTRQTT